MNEHRINLADCFKSIEIHYPRSNYLPKNTPVMKVSIC